MGSQSPVSLVRRSRSQIPRISHCLATLATVEDMGQIDSMKISRIVFRVYRWRRPNVIRNGTMVYGDGVLLLLDVHTDEGIVGQGWSGGTAAERPLEDFTVYRDYFSRWLVGRDPFASARIVSEIETSHIKTYGMAGAHSQICGGLNCALWDIKGKYHGQPVHSLLAGENRKRRVRAYIAGGYYLGEGEDEGGAGIERLRAELRHNVEVLGAKAVKIKIGDASVGLEIDTRRVEAARDEVGPQVELMVDANCAFQDLDTAIAYAKAFKPYELLWLEEPFRPDAFQLHRELSKEGLIPIATGENIATVPHFQELIEQGVVDFVNADVAILAGGYDAGMEVARLAKERGCVLAPHGCQELQCHYVAAADEAEGRLEIYPRSLDPARDEIFPEPFSVDANGYVEIPDHPGIGRTPNVEALARYQVYSSEQ